MHLDVNQSAHMIKMQIGAIVTSRVSNVKKVSEGLVDYYDSVLGHTLPPHVLPDATRIGKEFDDSHLSRLLQLVLGAAVNCDLKENFISNIMMLDHETQLNVKQAIEELFTATSTAMNHQRDPIGQSSLSSIPTTLFGDQHQQMQTLKSEIKRINQELVAATDAREKATQNVYDLKRDLLTSKEENNQLQVEIEVLQQRLHKSESNARSSTLDFEDNHYDPSDASLKERFVSKLQSKVDQLQEDLFRMENMKEEFRVKNELLESEMLDLRLKNEELQRRANETRLLKDELDIHKQLSEKAEKYESTLEVYRKKLEEAADFKRKVNEDRNGSTSLKMDLEEEIRRSSAFKSQNDLLKKQIQELHSSLAEVVHRNENLEYEAKLLTERLDGLETENGRNKQELTKRLEEVSELKSRIDSSSKRSSANHLLVNLDEDLSSGLFAKSGQIDGLNWSTELRNHHDDDLNASDAMKASNNNQDNRISELESENTMLKQQLETLKPCPLTADGKADDDGGGGDEEDSNNYGLMRRKRLESVERLEEEIQEWKGKSRELASILEKKEQELLEISNRYKKCVSKAKQVARVLEPISIQAASASASNNSTSSLHSSFDMQLTEISFRDRQIAELEMEAEKRKAFTEVEERLMSVAFHSLVSLLGAGPDHSLLIALVCRQRIFRRNQPKKGSIIDPQMRITRRHTLHPHHSPRLRPFCPDSGKH